MGCVGVVGLVCICLVTSLHSELVANLNETLYDFINGFCQYDTLCLPEALSTTQLIRQPEERCCLPCLCTSDCVAGNCCPGSPLHPAMRATCRSQFELFNRHRGRPYSPFNTFMYKNYFVVDTCPPDSGLELRHACAEPEVLEDHVFVSTLDGTVIFKNAKCAHCNGIDIFQEWNMLLYNDKLHLFPTHNNTLSLYIDIESVWKTEYDVYSVARTNDADRMSVHECMPSRDEEVCKIRHGQQQQTDCTEMQPHLYSNRGKLFANIFCFVCLALSENRYTFGIDTRNFCQYEEGVKSNSVFPLVILLDMKGISSRQSGIHVPTVKLKPLCDGSSLVNPVTVSIE